MAETNRQRINRIDCEKDELATRVAKLEQSLVDRVTVIEGKVMREETIAEMPDHQPFDSVKRNARGEVKVDPDLPSYEERMAARRERDRAKEKEEQARRTEGLPHGYWRDTSGIVRDSMGNSRTGIESDAAARKAADAELAELQRPNREAADEMRRRLSDD